jgi:glycosyltransferase involved in cell wall biosynthesis
MVVIGTLEVGGAEMDLVRNLPAINREKFEILVYTFTARGALAPAMEAAGIPVHHGMPREPGVVAARLDGERSTEPALSSLGERLPAAVQRTVSFVGRQAHVHVRAKLSRLCQGALPIYWKTRNRLALGREFMKVIAPMARFIREQRIDVIHCILPNAYFYGTIAALLAGRTNIVMSRLSLNHYQKTMPFYFTAERKFLHRFLKVAVGNANSVLDDLIEEGIPSRKLFLLYNGIVVDEYRPSAERRARARKMLGLESETLVVTAVGNLHPYKGHADLISALSRIAEDLPQPWRLLVAGSDRAGHELVLRRMISEFGLDERVALLGHRDDVPEILTAADIHVMPSHEEGLPNSIIEAMASGLPIVASRVGGIPELVIEGENGLLVEPRDSASLAMALLALARDDDRRAVIGAANEARVRAQFSLDKSVLRYEELYESLTKRAGRSLLRPTRDKAQRSVA